MRKTCRRLGRIIVIALVFAATLGFGQAKPVDRIVQAVRSSNATRLQGNVHPQARSEFDRGRVDDAMQLDRVTLVFKLSQAQQDDLDTLLARQQDPASPEYHQWLTPEQYAARFGLTQSDLNKIATWLRGLGFSIADTARSRTWVAFSGTAGQVSAAFQTEIRHYEVAGKLHYANASEPSVPSAFANVISGIHGLSNFRLKPQGVVKSMKADFTSSISGDHYIAPEDFATIYNLKGLYNSGIDGTGQKLAVMGQTDINVSDISTFRSLSGLPAINLQQVLATGSKDPGIVSGDIDEASLDLEWSGAVARNATILYVYSTDVAGTSLPYAIDNDVAPVLSMSYGDCEKDFSTAQIQFLTSLLTQANVQGQTMVSPAGDLGAADCDTGTPATQGLAVDVPASLPYATGVGGTEFNEASSPSTAYWSSANDASNGSALSYIPEVVWNDGALSAGGGGASTLFPKPAWQQGTGVPNDGHRDVPDISLAASPNHDGYLVCSQGSCVNGYRKSDNTTLNVVGGTSAGVPTFAGIITLINQERNTSLGQGNVNPILYGLAATSPSVFHDITVGKNNVPCTAGSTGCPSSGTIGYSAGVGYDQASGLGSIDASALAAAWPQPALQMLAPANSTLTVARGSQGNASLTLQGTFSGTVQVSCIVSSSLANGGVSVKINGVLCPGPVPVTSAASAITLTVIAPTQSASRRRTGGALGAFEGGLLAVGLVVAKRRKHGMRLMRRRGFASFVLALMLGSLLAANVACGGGSSSGGSSSTSSSSSTGSSSTTGSTATPVSGTVTVQATSGSLSNSAQVQVTVN